MSMTGDRFCTICGEPYLTRIGVSLDHRCGGTPTYCGKCGENIGSSSNLTHTCKVSVLNAAPETQP